MGPPYPLVLPVFASFVCLPVPFLVCDQKQLAQQSSRVHCSTSFGIEVEGASLKSPRIIVYVAALARRMEEDAATQVARNTSLRDFFTILNPVANMPLAVVTGANSGIGNAFAELLIAEGYEVHAADVEVGAKLQALQCRLHKLDLRSPESIAAFPAQLEGKRIDVLLNVAGTMVPHSQDTLDTVTPDTLEKIFQTNTFGPLLLTQALLPNLLAMPGSVIGIVSSRVGSVGDNSTGGIYAYRASKAAVNSIGKCMAMDLKDKGIVVALLHPGIVNTNLTTGSGPNPEAVEPEEAASKLWKVLMSKQIEDTGKFWHREGFELEW